MRALACCGASRSSQSRISLANSSFDCAMIFFFMVEPAKRLITLTGNFQWMFEVTASEGDRIEISCNPRINTVTNPDGSKSIRYGNLLMALGLSVLEFYIKGPTPFHDRGFTTKDAYNRTPFTEGGKLVVEDVVISPVSPLPFEDSPVKLLIKGRFIEGCRTRKHSAFLPISHAPPTGEETTLTLVHYGTTRLRISQFPTSAEQDSNRK